MLMDLNPTTLDIAARLGLAVAAGAAIGFDRSERGRTAGVRTTILVCLAATLAMLEANLILGAQGKTPGDYTQMDVLRLPLGVLSGIGFIGAGAILRRGDMVRGLTTAATMWLTTVIGLCIGAGDIWLGVAVAAIAIVVLRVLKRFEEAIHQQRTADLMLRCAGSGFDEGMLRERLKSARMKTDHWAVVRGEDFREIRCEVTWKPEDEPQDPPAIFRALEAEPGVTGAAWTPKT